MEINVINMKNEPVEKLELPDVIASAEPNPTLIFELVRQYQAGGRQGTHATKTRGLVSGSGRKLWKQKGDRTRADRIHPFSIVAPWRHRPRTATPRLFLFNAGKKKARRFANAPR